jgi:hypothetical protein
LVADGLTNKVIAARLGISERTVESHLERTRRKLGFHHRSEIAAWITRETGSRPGGAAGESQPALGTADDGDHLADERRRADERERRADAREDRADQREDALDERERLLVRREMRTGRDS